MEVKDILTWSGTGLLLILSFIKLPKIEVNLWGWLAKMVGTAMNKDVMKEIKSIDKKMESLETKVSSIEGTLDTHVKEDKLETIRSARSRILRFHDEIRHGPLHTEEHYNDIIDDIDMYETYCKQNPEYPNMKAEVAIGDIKEEYKRHSLENSFLH